MTDEATKIKYPAWPIRQHAREIIRSLRESPERWETGQYEAVNKTAGTMLWIANRAYGLKVEISQHQDRDISRFNWIERRNIWTALKYMWRQKIASSLKDR